MPSANITITPCEDPTLLDSVAGKATKTAAYSVLLLLSLVGNSMVPAVVYRNPELHTSVNYFIASMSVSDVLIPIFALPERIKQVFVPQETWQIDGSFGSLLCKLRAFVTDTSIIVTVLTLVIVSLQRFFAVKYPFKTQSLREKKACFIVISGIWILSMLCSSLNFYTWRLTTVNTTTECVRRWEPAFNSAEADKIEYIVFQVLFSIIPLIILTSVYPRTIVFFYRKRTPGQLQKHQLKRNEKKYRRITYMLFTVVIVFLVPQTSLTVYVFLSSFAWDSLHPCSKRQVEFVLIYLSYIYQALNPFIYCMFNARYKNGFKKILCCASKCNYYTKTEKKAPEHIPVQSRK